MTVKKEGTPYEQQEHPEDNRSRGSSGAFVGGMCELSDADGTYRERSPRARPSDKYPRGSDNNEPKRNRTHPARG